MMGPELFARVLESAQRIAASYSDSELQAALAGVPAEWSGGEVTWVPDAPDGVSAEQGGPSAPVLCRGRRVGELRLSGAPAGGSALPALAGLVGTTLASTRALRECREQTERLQLDRVYFEQLFEVSPEAIVVLDRSDRVVRVNREFERLFGYTATEVQGRTINELIVPPDLQDAAAALTRDVTSGRSVHAETLRRRKDGSSLHVSILGTPVLVEGDQVAVYGIYRDITAQKEAEEALRRLSTTDELTGLLNRRGFFLLAEQQRRLAVRKKAELMLLYIDIDDFKLINDEHGHAAGDEVLMELGHILRSCFRDSDIVARLGDEESVLARLGGDEFVILAVDAGGEQGEVILTNRLQERMDRFNRESGHPYRVTLSVGAVRVQPGPDVTVDALISAADSLMYQDKRGRVTPPAAPAPD